MHKIVQYNVHPCIHTCVVLEPADNIFVSLPFFESSINDLICFPSLKIVNSSILGWTMMIKQTKYVQSFRYNNKFKVLCSI